jgi:CheY-like chemotaxis protein
LAKPFDAVALPLLISRLAAASTGDSELSALREIVKTTGVAGTAGAAETVGVAAASDEAGAADKAEATAGSSGQVASDPSPRHAKGDQAGTQILLAEDNKAVCEMLRMFLEGGGFRVIAVPTVQQALTVARQQPINLLLSDFRLQDGTAWELNKELQKIQAVPAVMLSGYSDNIYIERSKAAGFSEYLVKPVDEDQLLTVVRDVLARQ